jgi:hypothetical protein
MLYSLTSVLVISMLGQGQGAGPEIVNPHPTYGHLGAPRPKTGFLPGDTAHFSFQIKNLKADKDGKVAYAIAIVVTDKAGKVLFEQKPYKSVAQHFFGGDAIAAAARMDVPLDSKPGLLDWKVTVTDRTTKASTELKGQGKILPMEFGLVQVGTFADAADQVPIPPVGVLGGQLYISFGAVGFGRGKEKQPDLEVSLRILDDKGQPTTANPLTGFVNKDVPPETQIVPLQFAVSLDQVGRFTVELSAKDRISGKSATVSFPVRILSAE